MHAMPSSLTKMDGLWCRAGTGKGGVEGRHRHPLLRYPVLGNHERWYLMIAPEYLLPNLVPFFDMI